VNRKGLKKSEREKSLGPPYCRALAWKAKKREREREEGIIYCL